MSAARGSRPPLRASLSAVAAKPAPLPPPTVETAPVGFRIVPTKEVDKEFGGDEPDIIEPVAASEAKQLFDPASSNLLTALDPPPSTPLPGDGKLWDDDARTKRHVPPEDLPSAAFGDEYAKELIRRQLALQQDGVYQFLTILNGFIKIKKQSAWTGQGAGGEAIDYIFRRYFSNLSGTPGSAGGPIVDTDVSSEISKKVKSALVAGIRADAGPAAAYAAGITDPRARAISAGLVLGETRRRNIGLAKEAVAVVKAASELPDRQVGPIIREVVGLGNAQLGAGAAPPAMGVAPPPPAPPPPLADSAVPKGSKELPVVVAKSRDEVALELAEAQATNSYYQLFKMIQEGKISETMLKGWDLLYNDGKKYINPNTIQNIAKDAEAVRTIERLLLQSAGSRGTATSGVGGSLSHYMAPESTGLLFVEDGVRAAILGAFEDIKIYVQDIPLIAFMTEKNVCVRFAQLVSMVYHNPEGAPPARGTTSSGAVQLANRRDLLTQWLGGCRYYGGVLVPPSHDPSATSIRKRREASIQQRLNNGGDYTLGDGEGHRRKKYMTAREEKAARDSLARKETAVALLTGRAPTGFWVDG